MYQPYQNQMFGQQQMYGQNPSYGQRYEIIRVNGRNGAEALAMAPNSSALLLDNTDAIVWLVQTDGAGYKSLTPYSIAPFQPEPQIDVKSLNDRITRLEEMINGSQSDSTSSKKSKSE